MLDPNIYTKAPKMIDDRVAVAERPSAVLSSTGLIEVVYLKDGTKRYQRQGEVLSVGPDVEDIKPGDKVLFGSYGGEKLGKWQEGEGEDTEEWDLWSVKVKHVFGTLEKWVVLNG